MSVGESQKDTYLITASIAELGLAQTSSLADFFHIANGAALCKINLRKKLSYYAEVIMQKL